MAITLDDLRKKADALYAPYDITLNSGVLTLINPLRLPTEQRGRVLELVKEFEEYQDLVSDGGDVTAELHKNMLEIIAASASDENLASELITNIGEDIGLVQVLFEDWLGSDDLGEASSSPGESKTLEIVA